MGKLGKTGEVRIASINVNGINDWCKRREVIESAKEGCIDVLGIGETHLRGCGEWVGGRDGRTSIWEGVEGGVVWAGISEGCKGRAREGCALVFSKRVMDGVSETGSKGSRIVWAKGKLGIEKYAWVCVYAPVNGNTKKMKEEMNGFWKELSECLRMFEVERKVIVMGDMNAKVGCEEVPGIVGKWGVPGTNENGNYLVDVCAERRLFLANTCFEHKMIHRFTWGRKVGDVEQKGLIDYVAVDERLRSEVRDARVVRGMFRDSDHMAVLVRLRTREKWIYRNSNKTKVKRVRNELLREDKYKVAYEKEVKAALEREEIKVGEVHEVGGVYKVFSKSLVGKAEEVVGCKMVWGEGGGGDAWWSEEVKKAVKEKKAAHDLKNVKNISEEMKRERECRYRHCKNRTKRIVEDSKAKAGDEWGWKLCKCFKENKKLYYREVGRVRGERRTISEMVKDRNGRVLRRGGEVRVRWREHFQEVMGGGSNERVTITSFGMGGQGRRATRQGPIRKREVRRAISKLKMGKAPGVDGVSAEMLKAGGETVVEWMHWICCLAWEQGVVPEEWVQAIIIPIYKGKGCRNECSSYRGVSLLSIPGKVYGMVLVERVKEITECRISREQGAFMKGKGCIDQIFTVKMVAEKYLAKGRKMYAAFMDLEKAYDRVDWDGLWEVLGIYGVGGRLLRGVKAFYKDASACVRSGGELSELFEIKRGVRQGCVMSPWLFNIYMDGVIREMKARGGEKGVELEGEGGVWNLATSLFADDTVLMAGSEGDLQKLVDEFYIACTRRGLKVNVGKSKVMVFERGKREMVDFGRPYWLDRRGEEECNILMNGERLEEVKEFKYLGSVMSKYGGMDEEIKERGVKGRQAMGTLNTIIKNKKISVEVKKGLRDSIVLPTLTYGSETWTWNEAQQSKIRAVEMDFLRSACGLTRLERESNERIYSRYGMSERGVGMKCGVVEWVKRNTLRWFGHVERMQGDVCKEVYESGVRGEGVRGRPPVKWINRVDEYLRERGVRGLNKGREMCRDRVQWRNFCRGHPLDGSSRGERASEI